jgi:predicted unusual protein kinase regulating ubiquinone biosynthesis (AarF/ABC1/UbiB family)
VAAPRRLHRLPHGSPDSGDNDGVSELPRRTARRTAKLVGLPLGVAGRTALGIGKRVGGRPAEAVAAEIQARTAEQLFTVLGELKGGAMKVGQALSVMEAAMPEEWAAPYRATLTKLQEAAPPLPPAAVHAVLAAELGPRWRTAKFLEFDDIPAAAASIGQVHKATWRDGRTVAVKIQYPGAREALLSDLRQLSRLARVSAGWVPGLDIKPVMAELTSRMSEELDYLLEATHQRAFAKVFRGDPDFAIPEVVHASSAVLVSEWLPGVPLSRIIAEGDQPTRDAAAQLYLEFLLAGPQRAGQLHADPHPGNFRITPRRQARHPGLRRRQPPARWVAPRDGPTADACTGQRGRAAGRRIARRGFHQADHRGRSGVRAVLLADVSGAAGARPLPVRSRVAALGGIADQ